MNIICFHNPDEASGYLSNWYLSDFLIDDVKYSSMEQYMMYKKALCFNDKEIAEEILRTSDVSFIKSLGRKVKNYDDHVWNGMRQIIVYEGLFAKFSQNEDLKQKLLDTMDAILVECAVRDRIWGVGMSMNDPNRFIPKMWRGTNLLGYSLMLVRKKLTR